MSEKPTPQRTVERKEREAAALKANMKRRKEQSKVVQQPEEDSPKT
jgi:hypothetical protein